MTKGFRSSVLPCCRIADSIIYSGEGNRSENTKVMATSMGVLGASTWDRANTRCRVVNGWIEQGSVPRRVVVAGASYFPYTSET